MPTDYPPPPYQDCIDDDGLWYAKYGPYTADEAERVLSAVAQERARIRKLVEAVRDANLAAQGEDSFRLLMPQQDRAWLSLLAALEPDSAAPRPSDRAADPACGCATCRPCTLDDMRMILCATCGNKRCPHATDHRNACTGSNEPGQPGSAYGPPPAAPGQAEGRGTDGRGG